MPPSLNFGSSVPQAASSPFGPSKTSSSTFKKPATSPLATQSITIPRTPSTDESSIEAGPSDSTMLYLEPSAYERKGKRKWVEEGKCIAGAVSPIHGEIAAWITRSDPDQPSTSKRPDGFLDQADKVIYFASPHSPPDPVLNFYTETYTLFTSLQRIVASSMKMPNSDSTGVWDEKGRLISMDGILGTPSAETVGHMRRLVGMYLEELMKLRETGELDADMRNKWIAVYNVLHLADILYLPQDGRGEGLLGEEMLDWVNEVDPQPENSIGTSIMSVREPWTHPSFWPYIIRCLLRGFHLPASSFLRTLSSHPYPPISKIGILLSTHLALFPRSHNTTSYPLDHQFLSAHRSWLSRFRAELAACVQGKKRGHWLDDGKSGDKYDAWEKNVQVVVDVMEGNKERILEEAADWREALGAWGVLVNVNLRRDDLPMAMKTILKAIPIDTTILDDRIQSSLCQGDILTALQGSHDMDSWLAAHLGDVFDKLALIPDDEERFEDSLRDYFILDYVDVLQGNPKSGALWRIVADYLSTAGDEGRVRSKEHILHTALGLDEQKIKGKDIDTTTGINGSNSRPENGMEKGDDDEEQNMARFEHFTELREACLELRLEDEWKIISKIMADKLVRRGEYGLGATMCLQAEDGFGLSRIAQLIMEIYINQGEVDFLKIVDTLPSSLLNDAPLALQKLQADDTYQMNGDTGFSAKSIFASRLAFLSEFRDYLLFKNQGMKDKAAQRLVGLLVSGVTPIEFWAVLLFQSIALLEDEEISLNSTDTFELMRILEEVLMNSKYNPSSYLDYLETYLKRQKGYSSTTKRNDGSKEWEEVLSRLEEVRLALARNLARALVSGMDRPF